MKVPKKYPRHVPIVDLRGGIGDLINFLAGHTDEMNSDKGGLPPVYNGFSAAAKRRLKGRLR